MRRVGDPLVRLNPWAMGQPCADLVASVGMTGFRDDACVVAAAGEHKRDLGMAQVVQFVHGTPGRDVVALRANQEYRLVDIAQGDCVAVDSVAAGGQGVVQVERGQVLMVHAGGHAGGVCVPRHQIAGLLPFSHQVFTHLPCPDQVTRMQELEGTCHLLATEETLPARHIVQLANLAFVDKEAQFAGL